MQRYEYRVIPAPRRGEKARGTRTTEDRFALALTTLMNQMGSEGWEYQRADVLPCDERAGLTGGVKTSFQNMLVFRRPLAVEPQAEAPVAATPWLALAEPAPAAVPLKLGAAEQPAGVAPPIGPANPPLKAATNPDLVAE